MAEVDEASYDIEIDRFKCVTVSSKKVSFESDEDFGKKLEASIVKWQEAGVRAVWVKADIKHASLVPVCTKSGFVFHHAQTKYVMLKKWLADNEPDNLPCYANHGIGCAGFTVNEKGQVLVIQEKYHTKKHWKLPGGTADSGEDIGEAACREVLEETGIQCQFQGIICFRQQHQFRFGCSDLYYVCLLKPLTHEIKKCDHEIEKAEWMDLEEYLNHPDVSDPNRYFTNCYVDLLKTGQSLIQAESVISHSKDTHTFVYSIKPWDSGYWVNQKVPVQDESLPTDPAVVFSD